MDDNKIVELYLARNEAAIQESTEKYGRRLYHLAQGIVEDHQTAEECENDTYMAAWKSIPPHEPVNYFYAFLARITRHVALNCCRNRNRLKRSAYINTLSWEMEECIPAPNDGMCRLDEKLFAEAINGFLSGLSQEKRTLFVRRYWYLDGIADIAARYGLSQSKVKTTLYRLREQLRTYREKEGYEL